MPSHCPSLLRRVAPALLLTSSLSTQAAPLEWRSPVVIHGDDQPETVSAYRQPATHTWQLYDLDYDDLSQRLRTYEWVYLFGQVVHGGLFVLVKPKFGH